jgi:hypothetical protein
MNRRRVSLVCACAAVLVVASVCWIAPLHRSSQAAPAPAADGSFKGKLLFVQTQANSSFTLEDAHFRKMGDRSWLVGKGLGGSPLVEWQKGKTVSIQMDHIVSITEFDNLQELKKAIESGGWGGGQGYGAIPATVPAVTPTPALPGSAPVPAQPLPPPPGLPEKR